MRRHHSLETVAHGLRRALDSGAFAHRGPVTLSDGVLVDPERMARIVLTDFERIVQDERRGWLTKGEEHALCDDLLRLFALAHERPGDWPDTISSASQIAVLPPRGAGHTLRSRGG